MGSGQNKNKDSKITGQHHSGSNLGGTLDEDNKIQKDEGSQLTSEEELR